MRQADGGARSPLETYARLQSPMPCPVPCSRRMVRGVSTRDYAEVVELARDGFGVAKSSVSRDFVRASAADVQALAERRFDGERFPVVMIDGVEYAGETMIVALGITEDGTKRDPRPAAGRDRERRCLRGAAGGPAGRGLDTGQPTLLVLDGSKALHAAVTRVWGTNAVIQRCQVHKKRNVKAHVPEKHHAELDRQLSAAYQETTTRRPRRRWRRRRGGSPGSIPDAAASLREGLEETLTVIRLGLPGRCGGRCATTNPIESALSVTRRVTAPVTRWRDGDMRAVGGVPAGLLRAEGKFRRVKGHRAMPAPEGPGGLDPSTTAWKRA